MINKNDPINIAYAVVKILVDKGYYAGVLITADDVAVGIKLSDLSVLQIKINPGVAERGTDWIAKQIIKHLSSIN